MKTYMKKTNSFNCDRELSLDRSSEMDHAVVTSARSYFGLVRNKSRPILIIISQRGTLLSLRLLYAYQIDS